MKFIKLTTYRDPDVQYLSDVKYVYVQISKINSFQWCRQKLITYVRINSWDLEVVETPEQILKLCLS